MKSLSNLLRLSFLPANPDAGLLLLRLWIGLSMLLLHGWPKLKAWSTMAAQFPDPLHIGHKASLALLLVSEVGGSLLIVLGLFTRFAALMGIISLSVAFFMVHAASLKAGPGSGELAFIYAAGYVTLLFAGGGHMAVDGK
jgi:putative oxidoreductase